MRLQLVLAWSLLGVLARGLAGQVDVRTGVLYENYSFDSLVVFKRVAELSVPVVVTARLGSAVDLTLSTGYVRTELISRDTAQLRDQMLSGPVDTEARLGYHLVPGRLIMIATGAVPSGRKTVSLDQLAVLGALSSDVVGFSTPSVGSGGNFGAGLVAALPVNRWAVGLGATYRHALAYRPIAGQPDTTLQPGGEFRLRAGLEGALARRTYLRVAGVLASRQKDRVNRQVRHGVGNRVVGYVALDQGLGRASVSVYAFDVFRSNPQIEPNVVGAVVPRGNLFTFGTVLTFRLSNRVVLAPRVEYRSSALAQDTSDTSLKRAGESWRAGGEFRLDLGNSFSLVLQGSAMSGKVIPPGGETRMGGYRFGAVLELRP
jgi:hypothetical protein